jgi:hypothetical protein
MLPAGILAAALFALLAFAPFASAASNPVGSGTTTITLNNGFVKKLKKSGVKVEKLKPTTLKGNKATFTISGGTLDSATGLGTINLSGGIQFKAGKKKAPVKGLVLDTAKKTLTGNVAGKKLKLATVSAATATPNGFGVNIAIKSMKLTGPAAKQLNKKLGFSVRSKRAATSRSAGPPFRVNLLLGSSRSNAQPRKAAILPGTTEMLALNSQLVGKLAQVGVELKPLPASSFASEGPAPVIASPIVGESIAPDATSGIVKTSGGLRLLQSFGAGEETKMTLAAAWVDLGTKTLTFEMRVDSEGIDDEKLDLGSLGRRAFAGVGLTGATVTANPATRTVSVQNATATLGTATAERLNQVFVEPFESKMGAPAGHFAAGEQFGTFSFAVQTQ